MHKKPIGHGLVALGLASLAFAVPVSVSHAANYSGQNIHFSESGFAPGGQTLTPSAPTSATRYGAAPTSGTTPSVGSDTNVIGSNDVTQQATINGTVVYTCNPGKATAQNETTIAAQDSTLIGGANDYRLYEPSENRYDGSGGFYLSSNGGKSWTSGFLPGLVRANPTAPGPYESAGDPAVVAGPAGTFWYANLAFDRTDNANSVAVSRSTDGGNTWTTHYVVQTSSVRGKGLFNDKEWIAADPSDPTGSTAYVTWTEFQGGSSAIVISKTTNGGATWTAPQQISTLYKQDQGSTVVVGVNGHVYVTFETFSGSHTSVAFAVSSNGGATFATSLIAPIDDIPSPLPGSTWRTDSFPALAVDGSNLHVVWSNWNGTDADVVYMRSTDGGTSWSTPATIGGGAGDQFFPWVAASGGKVYASWLSRSSGDIYTAAGVASSSSGASWTSPVTLSSATSDAAAGNLFGYPNCAASFIGDYSGITVDASGIGHALWTDIRSDRFDPRNGGADQDPYTVTISAP